MEALTLYNTRTRRKEVFESATPGTVGMYTCGPTVYAPQHLGNLRSQLFADLLKRTFLYEGYKVTHIINITDVGHLTDDADDGDDKMEAAAEKSGQTAQEIAAMYTKQWQEDRERVGCLPAEVLPKATEHISEQIELAKKLEQGGYTYLTSDGLYFDTSKFSGYANFAGLDLEAQQSAGRVAEVGEKRNAADFALWKLAPEGVKRQQEWDSPWGRGFPGWHLECSAMSVKYLGENFDVHTGGIDHVQVHHTNEVAQSECGLGVHPWVRYWLHNEFLSLDKEKMSKSKGHVFVLDGLVDLGFAPRSYRYFFLQAHYRQQQRYTLEAMAAADTGYKRLCRQVIEVRDAEGTPDAEKLAPFQERFRAALRDDLNAPRALAVAWEVAKSKELAPADKNALFLEFDGVLGLDFVNVELVEEAQESDPRIDGLVQARQDARANKDFAESDRIRDELLAEGVVIDDTPEGPRWRRE
ncbi:MAG: cysteine--tRNA ligase [Deltaproteobacteria bacterium]|nr:cysteine--tRNA ligase [Deltaproteobacteria bacterium]